MVRSLRAGPRPVAPWGHSGREKCTNGRSDRGDPGVIGAFARMFGTRERLISYEETRENGYAVKARSRDDGDTLAETSDAPPEAFVEKIPHDGGDVYLAPVVEMLRSVFRRRGATLSSMDEKDEVAEGAP